MIFITEVERLYKRLNFFMYCGRHKNATSTKELYYYEIKEKLPSGNIKKYQGWLPTRYLSVTKVPLDQLMSWESKRPYQPGQACDGTIETVVTALLISFCESKHSDIEALYNEAYPGENNQLDKKFIKQLAEFEGVAYPATWNSATTNLLIKSLHNVNYHQLANLVEEKFL
jgi:hypothetical protein